MTMVMGDDGWWLGRARGRTNDKVKAVSGALTQVMDVYHFVLGTCCPFHATDILMCCCHVETCGHHHC